MKIMDILVNDAMILELGVRTKREVLSELADGQGEVAVLAEAAQAQGFPVGGDNVIQAQPHVIEPR